MKTTEKHNEDEQIIASKNELHSSCENQKTCVFGVTEGSLPQVMVPEGGDEAETPVHNLVVIFT